MKLTHICPNCQTEHEMAQTPEPDQLCPTCSHNEDVWKNTARVVIDFDSGNCPMKVEEAKYLEAYIEKICKDMSIKITKTEWYGVD